MDIENKKDSHIEYGHALDDTLKEIFVNITLYLKANVILVRLVIATALMAISRKVIIFDFEKITPMYVIGTGVVVLALGITYCLIIKKS